jgi:hypothetical protein
MKNYWIAFVLIVSLGLTGLVAIIYKCFIQKPESEIPRLYYLPTDSMREAGNKIADSAGMFSIFPGDQIEKANNSIPRADLFVCKTFSRRDSLTGDTLIVLLDVKLPSFLYAQQHPLNFGTKLTPASKLKQCRVFIPPSLFNKIKHCRYKYANVELITDDYWE